MIKEVKLTTALNNFSNAMSDRLEIKEKQKYTGWNNPDVITEKSLINGIKKDIWLLENAGDKTGVLAVDIANRCMMLFSRK
jgi:hypothetical protein